MNIRQLLISSVVLALGCVACASDSHDPDLPPSGAKTKVAFVVVNLVYVSGNADLMASDTAALVSAFKAAGFRAEFAGTSQKNRTGDPPYLGVSTQHNNAYCLEGVVRVHNTSPDVDVQFEVRQRDITDMRECSKALVEKIMMRVTPL